MHVEGRATREGGKAYLGGAHHRACGVNNGVLTLLTGRVRVRTGGSRVSRGWHLAQQPKKSNNGMLPFATVFTREVGSSGQPEVARLPRTCSQERAALRKEQSCVHVSHGRRLHKGGGYGMTLAH